MQQQFILPNQLNWDRIFAGYRDVIRSAHDNNWNTVSAYCVYEIYFSICRRGLSLAKVSHVIARLAQKYMGTVNKYKLQY